MTPGNLGSSGTRLWRSVADVYSLDAWEELILIQACRVADRLDQLAVEAAASPLTVTNNRGDVASHPCIVESRQQSLTLSRLIAALRLPSETEDGNLVRPQRRGGARAPYGLRRVQ